MWFAKARNQEVLEARVLFLREKARRRVAALEARWRRKRLSLERALAEFRHNLEYLRSIQAEGRYPKPHLERALLREELRIRHLEEEIRRLDEALRMAAQKVYRQARLQAARMASRSGFPLDLDALFPEVKDEPAGHA